MVGWTDFILTPYKGKGGKVGNSTGVGGTLGSGTLVCDTSTKIGHFGAKWTQNYAI